MTQPLPLPPTDALAVQIAGLVTAHPDVAGLHGGPLAAIATHLPGRRLMGVRVGEAGEPVEVGVVLRLRRPIPEAVASLRALLAPVCGTQPLDITVGDVAETGPGVGPAPATTAAAAPAPATSTMSGPATATGNGVGA